MEQCSTLRRSAGSSPFFWWRNMITMLPPKWSQILKTGVISQFFISNSFLICIILTHPSPTKVRAAKPHLPSTQTHTHTHWRRTRLCLSTPVLILWNCFNSFPFFPRWLCYFACVCARVCARLCLRCTCRKERIIKKGEIKGRERERASMTKFKMSHLLFSASL